MDFPCRLLLDLTDEGKSCRVTDHVQATSEQCPPKIQKRFAYIVVMGSIGL